MQKFLENLKGKNIHVVGVSGDEGSAVVRFLVSQGFEGIIGHDFCEKKDFKKNFYDFHDALSKKEKKEMFLEIEGLGIEINFKN